VSDYPGVPGFKKREALEIFLDLTADRSDRCKRRVPGIPVRSRIFPKLQVPDTGPIGDQWKSAAIPADDIGEFRVAMKALHEIPVTIPGQRFKRCVKGAIEFRAWRKMNKLDRSGSKPLRPGINLIDNNREFGLSRQPLEKEIQDVIDVFGDEKELWHQCRFEAQGIMAS
jgi:hypothetical protein